MPASDCCSELMTLSFLKLFLNKLNSYGLVQYYRFPRCAFDDAPEPKIGKSFKMLCSGTWLQHATKRCSCEGEHLTLMTKCTDEDGRVRSTGNKALMVESGRYPAKLGNFHVLGII